MPGIELAHLDRDGAPALAAVRESFRASNPGYDLDWHPHLESFEGQAACAVFFIQSGESRARVDDTGSEVGVGDIVLVRTGSRLQLEGPVAALRFDVPIAPDVDLPAFIRPDWDPRITDTPGGCAEETGAYRRILLTWLGKNGPYLYHALNAHRVRITDSFSHYHPQDGGFDEIYLVQMAGPEARLVVSEQVELIESSDTICAEQAAGLLTEIPLRVGDLVFLPRGTMHRGLGGVLAQIITVPGFLPGSEIGVDHHLKTINERLGLEGDRALPFNAKSSQSAVVK